MGNKRYIHDPDCAVTRDIAAHPDKAKDTAAPACTCRKRQKARLRLSAVGSGSAGSLEGHESLGNGNYRHRILNNDW